MRSVLIWLLRIKLLSLEGHGWGNLDDQMEMLESLTNKELYNEAYILLQEHKTGHIRPMLDVPNPDLLVPMIIEAVATLIGVHEKTTKLDEKSKYVLQQYLALHYIKKLKFIARGVY